MVELIFKEEVYKVVGAAMNVYNELRPGFLEAVYQEALEIEFHNQNIPFISQPELPVFYKEHKLKKFYVADFLVNDQIIVEIKAQDGLTTREEAQVINQLKASKKSVGLLINFGHPNKLEWKRLVLQKKISFYSKD